MCDSNELLDKKKRKKNDKWEHEFYIKGVLYIDKSEYYVYQNGFGSLFFIGYKKWKSLI